MVTVLFFGATAELAGTRSTRFDANPGMTLRDLISDVRAEFPRLAEQKLLASINQSYAGASSPVASGDEIGIFTAVSGG